MLGWRDFKINVFVYKWQQQQSNQLASSLMTYKSNNYNYMQYNYSNTNKCKIGSWFKLHPISKCYKTQKST